MTTKNILARFHNQAAEAERREIALEKLVALTGESRDDLLQQWCRSPEYFWDFFQRKVSSPLNPPWQADCMPDADRLDKAMKGWTP